MKKKVMTVFVTFILSLAVLPAQSYSKRQIEKRIKQFISDFNSGNAEEFVDIFSNKLYNQEEKKKLVANILGMHKKYNVDYKLNIKSIGVDGNLGYDKGTYTTTLNPKGDGVAFKETQAYMEIWQKEADGKWRIIDVIKYKIENQQKDNKSKDESIKDLADLTKYTGIYKTDTSSAKITTDASNKSLKIFIQDKLNHKLNHISKNEYAIDGIVGITLNFAEKNNKIIGLEIKQPSGTTFAKKTKTE